jgi:hypothetical protein
MDISKAIGNFAGGFAVITEHLLALDKKASKYKKRARAQKEKLATALQQAEELRRQLEFSAARERELGEAMEMLETELTTLDSEIAKLWEENCKLRVVDLAEEVRGSGVKRERDDGDEEEERKRKRSESMEEEEVEDQ